MEKKHLLYIATLLLMGGCSSVPKISNPSLQNQPQDLLEGEVFARVTFEPKSGANVHGNAWLSKSPKGIQVLVAANNASPGRHGIHVHEKGNCKSADGSSAGGHYNPTNLTHGKPNPKLHHVGDFGNIEVGDDGTGILNLHIPKSHFNPEFTNWQQLVGKSIIIHAKKDDLKSQPSGDSGDRVACGVIKAAKK